LQRLCRFGSTKTALGSRGSRLSPTGDG